MASILNVDQINNAAGTSAVTIDPSTGKPSFPNGANLPAGSVVQLAHSTTAGGGGSSSASSFTDTGVSVSITPKYATSKILIIVHQVMVITYDGGHTRVDFRCIEAGGTEIYRMDFHGQDQNVGVLTGRNFSGSGVFQCSSTSALTFKTQAQKADGIEGIWYPLWYHDSIHTIQALEIAQ